MEALIKMVTDKTGISREQATTAIQTVVGFLKNKMPAGMGDQVEAYVNGGKSEGSAGNADMIKDKMGGLFGK